MASTLQTLGIDRLSVEERIALVTAIWDSIVAEQSHSTLLTQEQRRELDRRLADHAANPDDVIPWEQIKQDALSRYRQ